MVEPGPAAGGSQRVRRVIAPLALSPRAAAVAAEAQRVARRFDAELRFVHVGSADTATRTRFDEVMRSLGLTAAVDYRSGKPATAILRAAADADADLIVAGALEREGALQYYVGSVARKIARSARCSVLLLTEPRVEATPPRRWVVAARAEAPTRAMLGLVVELARRSMPDATPQRIDLVTEYQLSGANLALEGELDARSADARRAALDRAETERLADLAAGAGLSSLAGVEVRLRCLRGRVGWMSAQYARRQQADLLFAAAPRRLTIWDKLFQYGVEFALESLPCALWLHRERR